MAMRMRLSVQDDLNTRAASGEVLNSTEIGRKLFAQSAVELAVRGGVEDIDRVWLRVQLQRICAYHGRDFAQLEMEAVTEEV